jgi:hypothetical protein
VEETFCVNYVYNRYVRNVGSVADPDPGSGAGIWDPEWVKNQDPDPGSGIGTNITDYISESSEKMFWVKHT